MLEMAVCWFCYKSVVWKLIKGLQTHCKVRTEFIFQGPGKPLLFLTRTFQVAGVNTQSNAHMAIQRGSGTLFLLSMNTALFFYLCCDLIAQIKWKSDMVIKVLYFVYLTLRLLMSYIYIYGAPILDASRSHTTTHHSR